MGCDAATQRRAAGCSPRHADSHLTCELTQIGRCRKFLHLLQLPCFYWPISEVMTFVRYIPLIGRGS